MDTSKIFAIRFIVLDPNNCPILLKFWVTVKKKQEKYYKIICSVVHRHIKKTEGKTFDEKLNLMKIDFFPQFIFRGKHLQRDKKDKKRIQVKKKNIIFIF